MAVNFVNGKKYIGVTAQRLEQRKRAHVKGWGDYNRPSSLHLAIKKYGEDKFSFFVMRYCESYQEALDIERLLIATWKPEYNQTKGGEGTLGYKQTVEVLKKRRENYEKNGSPLKGIKRPQWVIDKMRKSLKGKKLKLSESAMKVRITQGKALAERQRLNPRPASQKSRDHMRKQGILKRKKVICLSDGREFESATSAEKFYGLYQGAVTQTIHRGGNRKKLLFKYI